MKKLLLAGLALGLMTTTAMSQADRLAIQSEPARDGTPAWKLTPSYPDPTGNTIVEADGTVTVIPPAQRVRRELPAGYVATPNCQGSPICGREGGPPRNQLARVVYDQNLGYTFSYPYVLPKGFGGVPAVALDSKDNLWVFKRSPQGVSQVLKYDANRKLIAELPESVVGFHEKAHGMAVDAQDNLWITDAGQASAASAATGWKTRASAFCGSR